MTDTLQRGLERLKEAKRRGAVIFKQGNRSEFTMADYNLLTHQLSDLLPQFIACVEALQESGVTKTGRATTHSRHPALADLEAKMKELGL